MIVNTHVIGKSGVPQTNPDGSLREDWQAEQTVEPEAMNAIGKQVNENVAQLENRVQMPKSMGSSANLNTYTTPGMYHRGGETSESLVNKPPSSSFFTLFVERLGRGGSDSVVQTCTTVESDSFVRVGIVVDGELEWSGWRLLFNNYKHLIPGEPNTYNLGDSSSRFKDIYLANSLIISSDINLKEDVRSIDKKYIDFLMSLNPVVYKFKDDAHNKYLRMHSGFIAQEVEQSLYDNGLNTLDLVGLIISPDTKEIETGEYTEDENGDEIPVMKTVITGGRYGLRYEEFIAPLIKTVQLQQRKIEDIEERLAALESK